MARAGLRTGVVGATGALGSELLQALSASALPVAEVVPIATDRSLGSEIEFQGATYPVQTEASRLAGVDLVFLCAPPGASLDYLRQALVERVSCIDLSGALSRSEEVPTRIAGYGDVPLGPAIAVPAGPSVAWALVLQPLAAAAGLRRVVGTLLDAASAQGRRGIESLYGESIALLTQQEMPEPTVFPDPIAFDCLPGVGDLDAGDGSLERERNLAADLAYLLGPEVAIATTAVQVPAFVGHGAVLGVETVRPLAPAEACEQLRKAPGVEVWEGNDPGPNTRAVSGRDVVIAGRVRRDPSGEHALLLWLAADPLCLAASHAVQLAARRFL